MKTLHIVFTDKEHKLLKAGKQDISWHDYLLEVVELKEKFRKEILRLRRKMQDEGIDDE